MEQNTTTQQQQVNVYAVRNIGAVDESLSAETVTLSAEEQNLTFTAFSCCRPRLFVLASCKHIEVTIGDDVAHTYPQISVLADDNGNRFLRLSKLQTSILDPLELDSYHIDPIESRLFLDGKVLTFHNIIKEVSKEHYSAKVTFNDELDAGVFVRRINGFIGGRLPVAEHCFSINRKAEIYRHLVGFETDDHQNENASSIEKFANSTLYLRKSWRGNDWLADEDENDENDESSAGGGAFQELTDGAKKELRALMTVKKNEPWPYLDDADWLEKRLNKESQVTADERCLTHGLCYDGHDFKNSIVAYYEMNARSILSKINRHQEGLLKPSNICYDFEMPFNKPHILMMDDVNSWRWQVVKVQQKPGRLEMFEMRQKHIEGLMLEADGCKIRYVPRLTTKIKLAWCYILGTCDETRSNSNSKVKLWTLTPMAIYLPDDEKLMERRIELFTTQAMTMMGPDMKWIFQEVVVALTEQNSICRPWTTFLGESSLHLDNRWMRIIAVEQNSAGTSMQVAKSSKVDWALIIGKSE